jgi:DtxR family transcriptional regulator, Mn-dependent transcriptional regulator
MLSTVEENYLKAIFKLAERAEPTGSSVSTNALAAAMQTAAATTTDMLKRLSDKQLIAYERYKGVHLTSEGNHIATQLVRKHRLWEVFLTDKLGYAWDEVHDMAEQLEHVQGPNLTDRLDAFLGYPRYDPHGDPIPDANGHWVPRPQSPLSHLEVGRSGVIIGVDEHSTVFLQHLQAQGLVLGVKIMVLERFDYDHSIRIELEDHSTILISQKVAQNILINN